MNIFRTLATKGDGPHLSPSPAGIDIDALIEIKPEDLYTDVTDLVWEHDINYIDALVLYCDKKAYDIETICRIIPQSLRCEIEQDAKNLKLLKKEFNSGPRLPI